MPPHTKEPKLTATATHFLPAHPARLHQTRTTSPPQQHHRHNNITATTTSPPQQHHRHNSITAAHSHAAQGRRRRSTRRRLRGRHRPVPLRCAAAAAAAAVGVQEHTGQLQRGGVVQPCSQGIQPLRSAACWPLIRHARPSAVRASTPSINTAFLY